MGQIYKGFLSVLRNCKMSKSLELILNNGNFVSLIRIYNQNDYILYKRSGTSNRN